MMKASVDNISIISVIDDLFLNGQSIEFVLQSQVRDGVRAKLCWIKNVEEDRYFMEESKCSLNFNFIKMQRD